MPDRERLAREQVALAELGRRIIAPTELGVVLQGTVELVAETLNAEHATVLELLSPDGRLRLRAGVGWQADSVGHPVDSPPDGYASFVLEAPDAVVVDGMARETRFAPSTVLLEAGVTASVASCIPGSPGAPPFGVIGAHSTGDLRFTHEDGQFVSAVAAVLSSAISRHRRAIEMNDEILQTLVLAQYSLRHDRDDAVALLDQAIAHTRSMINRLLGQSDAGASATLPGDLRRQAPPTVTDDRG